MRSGITHGYVEQPRHESLEDPTYSDIFLTSDFDEKLKQSSKLKRSFGKRLALDTPGHEYICNKKVDSPMKAKFFLDDVKPYKFKKEIAKFIEAEMEYCQTLYYGQSIYATLLEEDRTLQTLFSKEEKQLLFRDYGVLLDLSKSFLKKVIDQLISSSAFKDSSSWNKLVDIGSHNIFSDYNLTEMVINSDFVKFSFGTLLHSHLNNPKYRKAITSCLATWDFRCQVLNRALTQKADLGKDWIKAGQYMMKCRSVNQTLEDFFEAPKAILNSYPTLIKKLVDSASDQQSNYERHELNTSLIALNLIKDRIKKQRQLSSFEEVGISRFPKKGQDKVSGYCIGEYNNNLEKRISEDYEFKIDVAEARIPSGKHPGTSQKTDPPFSPQEKLPPKTSGVYYQLVRSFKRKNSYILEFNGSIHEICEIIIKFIERQHRYAIRWNETLENKISGSLYACYIEKMQFYLNMSQKLVADIKTRVMNVLNTIMSILHEIDLRLKDHKKLRATYIKYVKDLEENKTKPNVFNKKYHSAKACVKFEADLKVKLPKLFELLDSIIFYVWSSFNKLLIAWVHSLVGERHLEDFGHLRSQQEKTKLSKNQDIIAYYTNAINLNNMALEEAGIDSIKG